MPPIETDLRHQKAVLWQAVGVDSYGHYTVAEPVEVDVRWQDIAEQGIDAEGNTIELDARVVVDIDVAVGSVLWLGELEDWQELDDADTETRLSQVVQTSMIPDIKNRYRRRVLNLSKYRGKAPTVQA